MNFTTTTRRYAMTHRLSTGIRALWGCAIAATLIDVSWLVLTNTVAIVDLRKQDLEDSMLASASEPIYEAPGLAIPLWAFAVGAVLGVACLCASWVLTVRTLRGDGAPRVSAARVCYMVLGVLVMGFVILCLLRLLLPFLQREPVGAERLAAFAALVLNIVLSIVIGFLGLLFTLAALAA